MAEELAHPETKSESGECHVAVQHIDTKRKSVMNRKQVKSRDQLDSS
jgi:hypothetical protein